MNQETLILNHMKKRPGVGFTTKDIYREDVLGYSTPYTSYVRALNNLVGAGKIRKTEVSVVEEFGRANRLFMYPR